MSNAINRGTLIGGWMAALVTLAAIGVFFGVPVTTGATALWFVVCLAPPAVLLMLWRDTPPTVAEVLNATERRS